MAKAKKATKKVVKEAAKKVEKAAKVLRGVYTKRGK